MLKMPKQFLSSRWLISSQLNVDFVFLQSIPNPLSLFVHLSSLLLHSVELMPSKWGLVMDRLLVLSRRFSDSLSKVQVFLWRLLELHILKMVAFFSVWVALDEVKAGGDGCCVREMTETNCTHMILDLFLYGCIDCDLCLSEAVCDEPGLGGVVVSGDALQSLQAHGILSFYSLGVCHHRV